MTKGHPPELMFIESPRDAWQGISQYIPATEKAAFINVLLKVGFDIVETGSFVSPKAIPQLSDTAQVIEQLKPVNTKTKIMVLVGNLKGAEKALETDRTDLLSYPFSISSNFLFRNLKTTVEDSLKTIDQIYNLCLKHGKSLLPYITMAFGNPYGDEWNIEMLRKYTEQIVKMGINQISFTDIIGIATTSVIEDVYQMLETEFPDLITGLHLHAREDWKEKIAAARKHSCIMFDSVLNGHGGCPMTGEELVGNVNTTDLLEYFSEKGEKTDSIDLNEFTNAQKMAEKLYFKYK